MGTLNVHFVGANVYVPHTNDKKLLVVMPNASKLGRSPKGAADGTRLSRHVPFLWERLTEAGGVESVMRHKFFLGARLKLSFGESDTPTPIDLTDVRPLSDDGWLKLPPGLLLEEHDDRLAGQVLIDVGEARVYSTGPCNKMWHGSIPVSTAPVVQGISFRIDGVSEVMVTAKWWVKASEKVIYVRKDLDTDPADLFVGNQCAEDVLGWPHNSTIKKGQTQDLDFKWIFGVCTNSTVLNGPLFVPSVNGPPIHRNDSPEDAFDSTPGGGGAAGCECNGCVDEPASFS